MKENRYDDEEFFNRYGKMTRAIKGLEGAGEWYIFRNILPDLKDKKVLDLGCGYGWHSKYAVENGAAYVLAIDISKKMLEKAREINSDERIEYRNISMEDLKLEDNSFDLVISSLSMHYVEDYTSLIKRIYNCLKKGGDFVYAVEHPIFTSYGNQDCYYDENGKILHFPLDNYFYEGKREAIFLGERVIKYHRTLTTYLNGLLECGFTINNIIEPQPPKNMMNLPEMENEMRRPMMLLVSSKKL